MVIFRILVVLFLAVIIWQLVRALRFLMNSRGNDPRVARALTYRVGLSLTLFLLLMVAYYFGLVPGHPR